VDPFGAGAESLACLLGGVHGAGHPAGEMDRDDVVAGREDRLVYLEEVADRRLRRRGEVRRRA